MPNFQHLINPQYVASGVADYFLFAPVSWFETIQCPEPGEVLVSLEHEFKTGKDWIRVLTSPNAGKVDANAIGETGHKKFVKKYSGFILGSSNELHATMKGLINEPVIMLVLEGDCEAGYYYQLGCECFYAFVNEASFMTGTLLEGKKGYMVEITNPTPSVTLYPKCDNIVPTFNWTLNRNNLAETVFQCINTTVYPAGVSLISQSVTISDPGGNDIITAPFSSGYLHDQGGPPELWDLAAGNGQPSYEWIVTLTIETSNGCTKTAIATIDGPTIVYDTVHNGVPHNGTND